MKIISFTIKLALFIAIGFGILFVFQFSPKRLTAHVKFSKQVLNRDLWTYKVPSGIADLSGWTEAITNSNVKIKKIDPIVLGAARINSIGKSVTIRGYGDKWLSEILRSSVVVRDLSSPRFKPGTVYVGKDLCVALNCTVNKTLVLKALGQYNSGKSLKVRIAGVFRSGSEKYDKTLVVTDMKTAKYLFETEADASGFGIQLTKQKNQIPKLVGYLENDLQLSTKLWTPFKQPNLTHTEWGKKLNKEANWIYHLAKSGKPHAIKALTSTR